MSWSADFVVLGEPQSKGSWQAMLVLAVKKVRLLEVVNWVADDPETWRDVQRCFRANLVPDNTKSKAWEQQVKLVASRNAPPALLDEPVSLELHFVMRKPKRPKFPAYPGVTPDWDKLARSTSDALTGVVYKDDSRVVDAVVTKRYGDRPGCRIIVRTLETRQGGLFDEQDSEVCVLRDRVQQGPADEA